MGHQRDEEMTQFIAEFELTRSSTISDQQTTQDTIVALLEHISSSLAAEQDMPTKQRLKEMEKIKNLDEKIQIELGSLTSKIESMQGEMVEFEDIDGLSRRASPTVEYLNRLLKQYHSRRESVKQQVAQLTSKYEGMKKELQASETWKKLQAHVETKGRETDFESIKENCNSIVDKLNKEAKERSIAGPSIGTMRPAM